MPVYDRNSIPASVGRGVLDADLKAWLPKGPVLGADEPVATQRASHAVLGQKPWPNVGSVEHLVLDGPHGSLAVRVHVPSRASGGLLRWGNRPRGALVYLHGGGWTVGTLDEFEVPMRLLAERAQPDESLHGPLVRGAGRVVLCGPNSDSCRGLEG